MNCMQELSHWSVLEVCVIIVTIKLETQQLMTEGHADVKELKDCRICVKFI